MRYLQAIVIISILFITSCSKESTPRPSYKAGLVFVSLKDDVSIGHLFQNINEKLWDVESIGGYEYEITNMSIDSVTILQSYLRSKAYLYNTEYENYEVVISRYDTLKRIAFVDRDLFNMSDVARQQDWLQIVEDWKMADNNDRYKFFTVRVPAGQELHWVEEFKKYDIVENARLEYLIYLE